VNEPLFFVPEHVVERGLSGFLHPFPHREIAVPFLLDLRVIDHKRIVDAGLREGRQCNTVLVNIDADDGFCRCLCSNFGSFVRDSDVQFFASVLAECFGSPNVPVIIFDCLCE